ncbi:unnamed protein product [Mytilus edulis]|uniref:F-box domain-containing protein n=1 Tax=Mytilus edulis TaxID=6550 RepID=A0A8S3Q6G8_MYTED|nr:unnamed protein product [Mytilus edulis]
MDFKDWLESTKGRFSSLCDKEKTETLHHLLELCGSEQLSFLVQVYLPTTCQVDFFAVLPNELSHKIINYLDVSSAFNSRLVNKTWNRLVTDCISLWSRLIWEAGMRQPLKITRNHVHTLAKRISRNRHMADRKSIREEIVKAANVNVTYLYLNGNMLAIGGEDRFVYIWNIRVNELEKVIAAHSIADLNFDKEYLYTASYDNSAAVWSFATESMYCLYAGHINGVMSIDVNREDNLVLTGSADYTVKVWDFHSGHMLNSFSNIHFGWVKKVKFLEKLKGDRHLVISSDAKGNIFIWTFQFEHNWSNEVDILKHLQSFVSPIIFNDKTFCVVLKSAESTKCTDESINYFSIENLDTRPTFKLLKSKRIRNIKDKLLIDAGRRFAVFMVNELDAINLQTYFYIYDIDREDILQRIQVPKDRCEGVAPVPILGDRDWLDGFTDNNQPNLLFISVERQFVTLHYLSHNNKV